jgi:hypothetical protein
MTMPILTLQKRARELGRIRIGQKGDRGQPQKLDRFRITSPAKHIIEKVAELYGGDVREWTPTGGAQQWEVITDATRIPIMVPPQPVSQFLETWSAGGCIHRCDGETNFLTGEPCDVESREHQQAKPTTRLNVVLRDVEGIGVFRLESHGWNAAAELPQTAEFLAHAGSYINGWVALEERVSKSDGQTRRFVVPTIEIGVTPAELMAGKGRVQSPMVEGPVVERPAIEASPANPATDERPNYLAQAKAAVTLEEWRAVWHACKDAGHGTPELVAELTAVGEALRTNQTSATTVDAPVAPGPDDDQLWQQIMTVAGGMQMDLSIVNEDFAAKFGGLFPESASTAQLEEYLADLRERAAA